MVTDFKLVGELVTELRTALASELPAIRAKISSDAIPLDDFAGLYVGFFDPIAKNLRPALFIVPGALTPENDRGSFSTYEAKLHVDLFVVSSRKTDDDELASYELYNYVKELVVFVNGHLDRYRLSGDIEFYEALGADRNQRWATIGISADTEIRS